GGALAGGRELLADTVVLAASSYGSPAILLRSGIGPRDELGRHGISAVAELPVGEGLIDHVGTGVAWEPTERLQREAAEFEREHLLLMGGVMLRGRSRSCPPELFDLFVFPAIEPGYEISAAAFANLYVADASMMPSIPRVPVHLSTIAVAERASEWI